MLEVFFSLTMTFLFISLCPRFLTLGKRDYGKFIIHSKIMTVEMLIYKKYWNKWWWRTNHTFVFIGILHDVRGLEMCAFVVKIWYGDQTYCDLDGTSCVSIYSRNRIIRIQMDRPKTYGLRSKNRHHSTVIRIMWIRNTQFLLYFLWLIQALLGVQSINLYLQRYLN